MLEFFHLKLSISPERCAREQESHSSRLEQRKKAAASAAVMEREMATVAQLRSSKEAATARAAEEARLRQRASIATPGQLHRDIRK